MSTYYSVCRTVLLRLSLHEDTTWEIITSQMNHTSCNLQDSIHANIKFYDSTIAVRLRQASLLTLTVVKHWNTYRIAGYYCESKFLRCWTNCLQQKFLRLLSLQEFLTTKALFTWKYKNFSLPAENFCKGSLYSQVLKKFGLCIKTCFTDGANHILPQGCPQKWIYACMKSQLVLLPLYILYTDSKQLFYQVPISILLLQP